MASLTGGGRLPEKQITKLSKRLSYVLRHKPDSIGITLDGEGWGPVDFILNKLGMSSAELDHVVETNNKKRFEFSGDKTKIRARQGHSINVDLGYNPVTPPDKLYHGTAEKTYERFIKTSGLSKMKRHHVHLSPDAETAKNVGGRHGKPIVLRIDAKAMHAAGYEFYKTDNNVWLVHNVPPGMFNVL